MKYKKYILILLLLLLIGINRVQADDVKSDKCYYFGDDFKATFSFGKNYQDVYIDYLGGNVFHDSEDLLNWRPDLGLRSNTTIAGHTFSNLYSSARDAHNNAVCPNYIVFQFCTGKWKGILPVDKFRAWGTDDSSEAIQATNEIESVDDCTARYATFKHSDGTPITAEEYYSTFIDPNAGGEEIPMDDPETACREIFGDPNYAGETDVDENGNGYIDPPSLAYLINSVLKYVRVIVPILIIVLGSLDFAKAATAGKADEMKKAQITFVKRLIAGIIIFFVPVIVNLIMWLADIVWDGMGLSHCNIP